MSSQLRIGVVGCGRIGRAHATAVKATPGATLVAVADVESDRATKLALATGAIPLRTEDLVSRSDIDAVVVAVPTFLHASITVRAAEESKHVLVEKPMAMTLAEASSMFDAADRHRVVLMNAHNLRYAEVYIEAAKAVRRGVLGSVTSLAAERISGGQGGTWNGWIADPGRGLGAFEALVHDLDIARWLLGPATALSAGGVRGPLGAWETVQVLLRTAESTAILEASIGVPPTFPFSSAVRVVGSDGVLLRRFSGGRSYDDAGVDSGLTYYPRLGDPRLLVPPRPEEAAGSIERQMRAFVKAVRDGSAPEGNAASGIRLLDDVEHIQELLAEHDRTSVPHHPPPPHQAHEPGCIARDQRIC